MLPQSDALLKRGPGSPHDSPGITAPPPLKDGGFLVMPEVFPIPLGYEAWALKRLEGPVDTLARPPANQTP